MPRPKRPAGSDEPIIQARRIEALDLRKAGFAYAAIGKQLKVSGEQARLDVMSALKQLAEHQDTETAEYRNLELERLDRMMLAVWSDAIKGHLGAVDRVLKISERRARLMGLDAPVKQEVEHSGAVAWSTIVKPNGNSDPFA
jgi:orotate phosphoribosyltransferase-like protein